MREVLVPVPLALGRSGVEGEDGILSQSAGAGSVQYSYDEARRAGFVGVRGGRSARDATRSRERDMRKARGVDKADLDLGLGAGLESEEGKEKHV